jgi:hypothetical protein
VQQKEKERKRHMDAEKRPRVGKKRKEKVEPLHC